MKGGYESPSDLDRAATGGSSQQGRLRRDGVVASREEKSSRRDSSFLDQRQMADADAVLLGLTLWAFGVKSNLGWQAAPVKYILLQNNIFIMYLS